MRRLSGTYDGVEYVILQYDNGMIECPLNLVPLLRQSADEDLPTGDVLDDACRVLFGDSLVIREMN